MSGPHRQPLSARTAPRVDPPRVKATKPYSNTSFVPASSLASSQGQQRSQGNSQKLSRPAVPSSASSASVQKSKGKALPRPAVAAAKTKKPSPPAKKTPVGAGTKRAAATVPSRAGKRISVAGPQDITARVSNPTPVRPA
ncbi:hypothetical protein P7C70_g9486, partial [Phenoliferia sp. Uapishka_3]